MAITRHVYETYVKATPDRVWQAITDPDFTQRYFFTTRFTAPSLDPGTPFVYVGEDGNDVVVGEIVEAYPFTKLVMTWSFRMFPAIAAEPPSRVEWELRPAGDGITRLTLRHGDLANSPITWGQVRLGWVGVLDNMKSLLETGEPLGIITDPNDTAPDDVDGDWHRAQAIAANNATWELLGAETRTAAENEEMARRAYTAGYHWDRAAGRIPANSARGDWLLSRVWVVQGNGELALQAADRCRDTCVEHGLVDFDLAYAHEARARALACLGRHDEAAAALLLAKAVPVADNEDRELVESDLASEPWFGLSAADESAPVSNE
jgi:uncharacterized protein YndB with AHSA1/START domain